MNPRPTSLSGLLPFVRPYKGRVALAGLFLLLAAGATLAFPWALRQLIDQGFVHVAYGFWIKPRRSGAHGHGRHLRGVRVHPATLLGVEFRSRDGGGVAGTRMERPGCPVQLHFGEKDTGIPLTDVEAIRAAAFAQFAERGYPVVTVRDIMKACGLTQGALAEAMGVPRKHVNELCNNRRSVTRRASGTARRNASICQPFSCANNEQVPYSRRPPGLSNGHNAFNK